jgi:glycerate kinase
MKILIATDSFKDCLSAREVGNNLCKGLKKASVDFNIRVLPVADGGEGTVSALVDATNGQIECCVVKDPLFRDHEAHFGILGSGRTAVIEMASASGIELLKPGERNPWITTTYGTGQLILKALDAGCSRIIIGIGGSATNDGGIGMAMALGAKFLDANGSLLRNGGGALCELDKIDLKGLDPRLKDTEIVVACDVTNPLAGPDGASYVYGPQKGADVQMVEELDRNLLHLAHVIKRDIGSEVSNIPGAGAAGGLGAGLMAFCDGKLESGFDIVARETELEKNCKWSDIIITGEGKIDNQTKNGKTPQGVVNVASGLGKTVIAVAGTLGEGYTELYETGFQSIFSIIDRPMSLNEALKSAPKLLENLGFSIGKMLVK